MSLHYSSLHVSDLLFGFNNECVKHLLTGTLANEAPQLFHAQDGGFHLLQASEDQIERIKLVGHRTTIHVPALTALEPSSFPQWHFLGKECGVSNIAVLVVYSSYRALLE